MKKKYKLTNEGIIFLGRTLYRIEALKDFCNVKKGDKGGYVESEKNLSQDGDCWIHGYAKVCNDAKVCGNAQIFNNAQIFGNAEIYYNAKVHCNAEVFDNACVFGNAQVYGNAQVCGKAWVSGDAEIKNDSDYIVFKNWWSSGRYFTWTKSNNMWKVGCFYGTGEELIVKAYKDSELSGREYKRVVDYVESISHDVN